MAEGSPASPRAGAGTPGGPAGGGRAALDVSGADGRWRLRLRLPPPRSLRLTLRSQSALFCSSVYRTASPKCNLSLSLSHSLSRSLSLTHTSHTPGLQLEPGINWVPHSGRPPRSRHPCSPRAQCRGLGPPPQGTRKRGSRDVLGVACLRCPALALARASDTQCRALRPCATPHAARRTPHAARRTRVLRRC